MANRLAAFLKIQPGEGRLAALVAGMFALIEAGRGFGANTADALFFTRFGVENLPFMFMALGAGNFLFSLAYAVGISRFKRAAMAYTTLGLAALLLAERAVIAFEWAGFYPALWLTVNVISLVLGLLSWTIATAVCHTRQAKRLFPIFTSTGILGGVIGNLLTGPLATLFGTENLLIVYGAILLALTLIARSVVGGYLTETPRRERATFLSDLGTGFSFVRASPLMRIMAAAAVLFSILYFSVSFPFSQIVSDTYMDEARIAGFLGVFSSVATGVTFLVSLFLANRLYTRIGIMNSVLLVPLVYVGGFVLFAVNFTLPTATIVRMAQLIIIGGVGGSAYNAIFNVVPSRKRGQVQSFMSGVPEQAGVILSGAILLLGDQFLTPTQIFIVGITVGLVCAYLMWRARKTYGSALIAALRAGRYEVFVTDEAITTGYQGDAGAIQVAVDALSDENPASRRMGAYILGRLNAPSAPRRLAALLDDPDPHVKAEAALALGEVKAAQAAGSIMTLLDDPDPLLRRSAIEALPALQPLATGAFIDRFERLTADPDPGVRVHAAAALARFGQHERAWRPIKRMLADPDPAMRLQALEGLDRVVTAQPVDGMPLDDYHIHYDLALVLPLLEDPTAAVRRAACEALGDTHDPAAIRPLAERLADPDSAVRQAAAQALKSLTPDSIPAVLGALASDNPAAQDAALDALPGGDAKLVEPLTAYAQARIEDIKQLHRLHTAVPASDRVTALLHDLLHDRRTDNEMRLVKTIGLLEDPEAMRHVARGLQTDNAEMRAAAVEALDTIGARDLAGELIPLLEQNYQDDDPLSQEEALDWLLEHGDLWLRALAVRAIGELGLLDLAGLVETAEHDTAALMGEAARDARARLEGQTSMDTFQTLTSLERVLLLRDVPLFAGLSPDDLKQIADIAREQYYADQEIICREGDEGHEMFIITGGEVRVLREREGRTVTLATRMTGDFVGEMALIESALRSATLQASGEVRALVIEDVAFRAILRDRPEVSLALLQALSRRLRERDDDQAVETA